LALLLEDYPDINIAGQAETGTEALEKYDPKDYDVILLDIRMPDISGIEVAYKIREKYNDSVIIMLSMRDEHEVLESLPEGVPFISKVAPPEEIIQTIRRLTQ
jgi:two-component system LytT family response regulator/two-component system response regulator LytT